MIFKNNPNLIQCRVVLQLHLINNAEVWVTSWRCGSGRKYYFILGTMWASAELPSCSCVRVRGDGRKRWAERLEIGNDELVGEGRGRTSTDGWEGARGAERRSTFKKRGGPKERGAPSLILLQGGRLSPASSGCSPRLALLLGDPSWGGLQGSCSSWICNLLLHMQQSGNSSSALWLRCFSLCRKGLPKELLKWSKSFSPMKL